MRYHNYRVTPKYKSVPTKEQSLVFICNLERKLKSGEIGEQEFEDLIQTGERATFKRSLKQANDD